MCATIALRFLTFLPFACAFALCSVSGAQTNSLRTVALTGMPVGSSASSETFNRFSGVNLNNSGDIAFYAEIAGTGTLSNNDTGIWVFRNGLVTGIVREGQQVSGLEDGVLFGDLSVDGASQSLFNSSGTFVFPASVTGSGVSSTNSASIWSYNNNSEAIALIARDGDRAPETSDGVRFIDIDNTFSSDRGISLSESGSIAFAASTQTDGLGPRDPGFRGNGIWADSNGNQSAVIRSDDAIPSAIAGLPFGGVRGPMLTTDGQIIFQAPTGGLNAGLWRKSGDSFVPIVREGEQAADSPDGVAYRNFLNPTISQNGQIAFHARIRGNIGVGDYGVWGGTLEQFSLVALDRELAPGFSDSVFEGPSGNPFSSPAINSVGEVAFEAEARRFPTSRSSIGVWSEKNAMLDLVVALSHQTPAETGLPQIPGNIAFRSIYGPTINESGQVAFGSLLLGEAIDDSNDIAIWAEDRQGELQLIAREGDTIEVAAGDFRTISELSAFSFGGGPTTGNRSQFNDFGQVAFSASFVDGTEGVFVSNRVAEPEALLGDCNLDGVVDFLDIGPFIAILSADDFLVQADINEDGAVNFLDIGPFIALLSL